MYEFNKIYNEHVLQGLTKLPDSSIDMCITSPPYWALRDYKSVDIVWDGNVECEHQWGEFISNPKSDSRTPEEKIAQGATVGNSIQSINFAEGNCGRFCSKCGAWRGQLGLEPSYDLFIKHLCDIFDEVKRVLKKEGSCWVNLGDTYYSLIGDELEQKNLCNIPARFSIEMQNPNWILREDLNEEEKEFVIQELIKRRLFQ